MLDLAVAALLQLHTVLDLASLDRILLHVVARFVESGHGIVPAQPEIIATQNNKK